MPIVRGTLVTPGVAFDLSVNRESSAFMGSILEADVNNRFDFIPIEFTAAGPLKERNSIFTKYWLRESGEIGRYIHVNLPVLVLFRSFVGRGGGGVMGGSQAK